MKKINLIWIIGLFLLALPFVNATNENLTFSYGFVSNWAAGQHVYLEVNVSKISPTNYYNLTNISKTSASTATTCNVFNKTQQHTGTPAATGSYVNNVCTISGGFRMVYNASYRFADSGFTGGDARQDQSVSLPKVMNLVTINDSGYGDSGAWTSQNTQARSINSFEGFEVTPAPPPAAANVNITLQTLDLYDSSAINNFSVKVYNGSVDFNLSTLNGTIVLNNLTESNFFNITFSSNANGGYFNKTYQVNLSQQIFYANLTQAFFYVNITEVISGNRINVFGVTANSTAFNASNSTFYGTLRVRAGTYNITVNSSPYFNMSGIFTISALEEKYINLSGFGTTKLIINATVVSSSDIILNFTTFLNKTNNPYQNFSNNLTTQLGWITYYLLNGTYGINFQSDNYANSFVTLTLNSTLNIFNYTFAVYTTNSINFSFYDEITGKSGKLNESSIIVQLVSDIYSTNFSTNNGSYFIDLVSPAEYRVTYITPKYRLRNYYFTLKNRSNNALDLYLLSITNGTLVTFTVQDENAKTVEGAQIKLLRYYTSSNSYIQVDASKTDQNGNSIMDVDYNNAFYQTITSSGTASTTSQGTQIYTASPLITLNFGSSPINNVNTANGIGTSIAFNNNTQTFSFSFNDDSGLNRIGTLRVNQITSTGNSKVCESTTTSPSATLLCAINTTNLTGSYIAQGFIQLGSGTQEILRETKEVITGYAQQAKNVFQLNGMLLAVIFAATVAGLGAVANPAISIVMFIAGLGTMFFGGFALIPLSVYISISIVGLFIAYKIRT